MFLKLKDAGWYCIPVIQKTKKPALILEHLGGFTGISYDGIPEEVLEEWDEKYKDRSKYGIALVLGKINNVSAVDIDSDDFKLVSLIPESPLIKKGNRKRIGTSLFQHNPDLNAKLSFGDPQKNDAVDFLNGHNITILPPTIHSSGEPYLWVGEATALMHVKSSELPRITKSHLEAIDCHYKNKFQGSYSLVFGGEKSNGVALDGQYHSTIENGKERCAHGSQDRIKTKAMGLLFNKTSIDDVVRELINYDKSHHLGISYFEDTSRGKDSNAGEIYTNALGFVSSLLRTVNNHRKREKKEPLLFFKEEEPRVEGLKKKDLKPTPKIPPCTGMMKVFVDYLNNASNSENTEVYTGAALAWLSMLTASRYAVKTKAHTTPANLMLWGIMPSGAGKDAPQSLLQRLFFGHRILGASNYKSAPALLMKLNNVFKKASKGGGQELVRKGQRENLIIMDECSSLFRMMVSGENYQQDMVEVLNTIYSRSGDFYAGDQSVLRGADYGAAYNPYFTLMGFTTNNHFKNIMGSKIVGNGFFERSLIFLKQKKSPFNVDQYKDIEIFNELKSFTDHCLSEPIEFISHGMDIAPEREITTEVNYKPFPISQEAEDYLLKYKQYNHNKDLEGSKFDTSFDNRFAEIVTKVSMLHALSEQASFISIDNIKWAQSLVEWSYSNAKPYLKNMIEQDPYQKAISKIEAFVSKTPENMAPREDLIHKVRFEPKGQKRSQFLTELIDMGFLKEVQTGTKRFIEVVTLSDTAN